MSLKKFNARLSKIPSTYRLMNKQTKLVLRPISHNKARKNQSGYQKRGVFHLNFYLNTYTLLKVKKGHVLNPV